MKVKPIVDIETALRIYYEHSEIDNNQIRELFGNIGSATQAKYKKAVKEEQATRGIKTMQMNAVNTEIAYDVWGIDVEDLEKRHKKLKSLGLIKEKVRA